MAKIKRIKEDAPSDWQTIFCSLSILLVAFFVMLCSMATMEQGKMVEIRRSFQAAVNIFPGGILFDKGEGILVPSPDESGQRAQKIASPIYALLKGKGLEDKINLKSNNEYISLILLDSLLYEDDSTELTMDAEKMLKKLALVLGDITEPIRIEGHTDDRRAKTDRYHSNWELSAMRAINVMKLLKKEGHIRSDRISAVGFSQYSPFVPNKTDEERKRNRRVEIIIPIVQEVTGKSPGVLGEVPPSFKVWDLKG